MKVEGYQQNRIEWIEYSYNEKEKEKNECRDAYDD